MANVVVEMSGDEGRLWKSYQKIIDQSKKLDESNKRVKASGQQAGQQMEQSFGQQAHARLVNLAAGMATVSGGVRLFTAAMAQARAETQGAIAAVDQLVASRRQLLQVSGSAADAQQMNVQSDKLARMYGISRGAARDLMFSARSEGFEGTAPEIAKLAGANVLSSEAAAKAAGQVPGLFPNAKLTGSQAINAVLTAARASRLNFEQVAGALPMAAEGAAMAGSTPSETMALTSVLASRFASGEAAAARIKAIGSLTATRPEMAGGGIIKGVEQLQAMPDAQRQKILGRSQELQAAYMVINQEMPVIRERQAQIEAAIAATGTPSAATNVAVTAAFDPSTAEGRLNRQRVDRQRAAIALEINREQRLAGGGLEREARLDAYRNQLEVQGRSPIARYLAPQAVDFAGQVGLGARAQQAAGTVAEGFSNPIWQGFGEMLGLFGNKLDASADNLRGASEDLRNSASNVTRQRAAAAVQPE